MSLYRIYIGETGNHDLSHADDPNQRFLALTGVILESEYNTSVLQPEMNAIKREFFQQDPDMPVIFHRKEMVNRRPPFHVLRDGETEKRFNQSLLDGMERWQYQVITVMLDKKAHRGINIRYGGITRIITAWQLCLKGLCYSCITVIIAAT
jgi:hypothetical protein